MQKLDYDINIDYSKIFETWEKPLQPLLQSDYMHNLMVFLHEVYKSNQYPRPAKKEIFEVFKKVQYNHVRVVILGGEPDKSEKGNGILFATRESSYLRPLPVTLEVEKCIEKTIYEGCYINFDLTLEHWFKQGVLPIHSTWTTPFNNEIDHIKLWRNFTRNLIKILSTNNTGIIFILLGQEARYYKKFINQNSHYILEHNLPQYFMDKQQDWNCPCFKRANQIIKSCNGTQYQIVW